MPFYMLCLIHIYLEETLDFELKRIVKLFLPREGICCFFSSLWGEEAYFISHTFVHILSDSLCSSAITSHCSMDG